MRTTATLQTASSPARHGAGRGVMLWWLLNQHPLSSAEASVTLLLSALLRTSEAGARWRSLFTLAHSVSNVMGGRILLV